MLNEHVTPIERDSSEGAVANCLDKNFIRLANDTPNAILMPGAADRFEIMLSPMLSEGGDALNTIGTVEREH